MITAIPLKLLEYSAMILGSFH